MPRCATDVCNHLVGIVQTRDRSNKGFMCGIVGYVGEPSRVEGCCLTGLERLEYRAMTRPGSA